MESVKIPKETYDRLPTKDEREQAVFITKAIYAHWDKVGYKPGKSLDEMLKLI